MKKALGISAILVLLSIFSNAQQKNAKVVKDSIEATLSSAFLNYGVPEWSSKWEGKDILYVEVHIKTSDGKNYVGTGEHRNSPIGDGNIIQIPLTFKSGNLKFITRKDIESFELVLTGFPGNPKAGLKLDASHVSRFRAEIILTFSDGLKLASGYNDEAGTITVYKGNGPTHVQYAKPPKGFSTEPTLKEKVQ